MRLFDLIRAAGLPDTHFARLVMGGRSGKMLGEWRRRAEGGGPPPPLVVQDWADAVDAVSAEVREDGSATVVIEYGRGSVQWPGRPKR